MEKPEIKKGTIVRYQDRWAEVTARFKTHVSLGSIFYGKTRIKQVPLSEVYEDGEAWHKHWEQSDAYRSM